MLLKLRQKIALYLLIKIKKAVRYRKPDITVGRTYLKRWHLIPENSFLNVYYHEIGASDLDRHLHDHPYFFSSFILEGGYFEHTEKGITDRGAGDLNIHIPWFAHRLVMKNSYGAKTIFITAPKIRKWGFKTEDGWIPNDQYIGKFGVQNALANPITVEQEEAPMLIPTPTRKVVSRK